MGINDSLGNIAKIMLVVVAGLGFYFRFIKGSDIKIVGKKYLNKDTQGLYKISFYNKGPRNGLINGLKLRLSGGEGRILSKRGTSFDYPVELLASTYLPCIINVDNILQNCKRDILHSMFFFFQKKECYKTILSYTVTSKDKTKDLKRFFYLLIDTSS